MISFFIPGTPVAQGRPRFARRGKFTNVYTPSKTREWRDHVQSVASAFKPEIILEGALVVKLIFYMPRPKSLPKKVVHHIKKPDLDNLMKAVIDSLQDAEVFKSDSQIVEKNAVKIYAEKPGVAVKIISIE